MKIDISELGNIESFYSGFSENYESQLNERTEDAGPREINLNKIDNIVFEDVDPKDYPDFCDAFVASADMHGWAMTAEELDDLNENHPEFIHEKLIESLT